MVSDRPDADHGEQSGRGTSVTRRSDEAGATAVEYGLVVGAVGVVFILAGPELLRAMLSLLGAVVDTILGGTP